MRNFKQFSFLRFYHLKSFFSKNNPINYKTGLLTLSFFCFSIGILSAQLEFTQKADIPSQIQIIDIHSADRNTIFAATNLGLYKSTNAGTTWTVLDTAQTGVVVLDVFALDVNTIFAYSFAGIRKSLDGGATWTTITIPSNNVALSDIFALDANTIFVADGNHRVHKSTDGGTTWSIIGAHPYTTRASTVHAFDTNTIIVGTGFDGVFKTTDGGANWVQMNNGISPSSPGIRNMDVIDANTIYISTFNNTADTAFFYKTVDGGATWTPIRENVQGQQLLGIHALDANTVFGAIYGTGVIKSTDGGTTWTTFNYTSGLNDLVDVVYPIDANTVLAGTRGGMYCGMTPCEITDAASTNITCGDTVTFDVTFTPLIGRSGVIEILEDGIVVGSDTTSPISVTSTGLPITQGRTTTTKTYSIQYRDGPVCPISFDVTCVIPICFPTNVQAEPLICEDSFVVYDIVFEHAPGRTGDTLEVINRNLEVLAAGTTSPIIVESAPADEFQIQYKGEADCGTIVELVCDLTPPPTCALSGVSVAAPLCGDSIIFEVSFTPINNRSGLIQVVEGGTIVGTGTTSPIVINYPDTTTTGKTFTIQYADAPNCATNFQVPGCNSCNPTDIVITKQSQIDSFQILYGTCDYVAGSLTIGDDKDGVDNITNLGGLLNLIQIGGDFICLDNPFLGTGNSFRGFNNSFNLQSVGGAIIISGNPNLTGLNLIENVTTVGGSITITNNDALTTIGLNDMETIGGAVTITDNAALTTIGLDNVATVGNSVTISDNSQLTTIDLFDNIQMIDGSVTIEDNSALTDFGNLANVMVTGTTNVNDNAGVFSIPSIADPCSCNDPQNIKVDKRITHFHDVLTVNGAANAPVVLVTGGANFLNGSLTQIANGTSLGNIPADGSDFTFDFFHPSDAAGSIVVSVNGTNLAPFSISVCSASDCTEPIPTMNEWGLLIFGLLVLNLGIFFVQRKAWML